MTKHWEYDAFISYRHLPLDQTVAARTQKLLERIITAGLSVYSEIARNCLPVEILMMRCEERLHHLNF